MSAQPECGPVVTMKTIENTEFEDLNEMENRTDGVSSHEEEILSTQNRASIVLPNVTEYEAVQRSDCFKQDESIDCIDMPVSNDHMTNVASTKEYFTQTRPSVRLPSRRSDNSPRVLDSRHVSNPSIQSVKNRMNYTQPGTYRSPLRSPGRP